MAVTGTKRGCQGQGESPGSITPLFPLLNFLYEPDPPRIKPAKITKNAQAHTRTPVISQNFNKPPQINAGGQKIRKLTDGIPRFYKKETHIRK